MNFLERWLFFSTTDTPRRCMRLSSKLPYFETWRDRTQLFKCLEEIGSLKKSLWLLSYLIQANATLISAGRSRCGSQEISWAGHLVYLIFPSAQYTQLGLGLLGRKTIPKWFFFTSSLLVTEYKHSCLCIKCFTYVYLDKHTYTHTLYIYECIFDKIYFMCFRNISLLNSPRNFMRLPWGNWGTERFHELLRLCNWRYPNPALPPCYAVSLCSCVLPVQMEWNWWCQRIYVPLIVHIPSNIYLNKICHLADQSRRRSHVFITRRGSGCPLHIGANL